MQLLAEVGEAEAGEVRKGVPVSFQIESVGQREFRGVVADVRLAPVHEQAGSTGTSGSGSTTAVATTGDSSSSRSTAAASAAGSSSSRSSPTPGSAASSSTPSAPAGSVVSYTAVVDVDNSGGTIVPGSTAVVMLPTAQRFDVLRVPNTALAFRPTPDMLKASGQARLKVASGSPEDGLHDHQGIMWKYESGKFVPISIDTGVSDERWTEVTAGGVIRPGDQLVTQVSLTRR